MLEKIDQRLSIDHTVIDELSDDLKTFILGHEGLDGTWAKIGYFGFISIGRSKTNPKLVELCSYGRPSEDFCLVWYYDIDRHDYVMFEIPYPLSMSDAENGIKLKDLATLAQFLEYLQNFDRTCY